MKDAAAVRNLKSIVEAHKDDDIMLVVSAMGKTTNALEAILSEFRQHGGNLGIDALKTTTEYHEQLMLDLFDGDTKHPAFESVAALFLELYDKLCQTDMPYDYHYDQTVCYGELISTTIIAEYLNHCGIPTRWLDARKYVITDDTFRAASPDWDETRLRITKLNDEHIRGLVCLTQGFIGSTGDGKHSTTLGREGSDFTAAIFANCLDANEVTIWKDVEGLLNADPKRFDDTVKIPHISFQEAIELAYYGATIIHPKTLKPLQNKNIPLKVQSFVNPNASPTVIDSDTTDDNDTPSYIVKDNQTLVSITPRDFSFMDEHNLQVIFRVCDELRITTNMIQTSALMLSFCFDSDSERLNTLLQCLTDSFKVRYNDGLQLYTIRHYRNEEDTPFAKDKKIYVKQGSRSTMQFVVG